MVAEKLLINTNSDKTLLKLKKNNHTYFFFYNGECGKQGPSH